MCPSFWRICVRENKEKTISVIEFLLLAQYVSKNSKKNHKNLLMKFEKKTLIKLENSLKKGKIC